MVPRIKEVKPLPDFWLHVVFDDGKTVFYDVKEDMERRSRTTAISAPFTGYSMRCNLTRAGRVYSGMTELIYRVT